MQTRSSFSHRHLSPLSYRMLKEGMWLASIQVGIQILSIIPVSGAAWAVDQNFHHTLHITSQVFFYTIFTTPSLLYAFSCFIWGASRVLNREDRLNKLTTDQLCLLALGSALAISAILKASNTLLPIGEAHNTVQTVIQSYYANVKSNFPLFTLLQKTSYMGVRLLSASVVIVNAAFGVTRFSALFKTIFQTGYALYRKL